jgi:hypothetical protein
MALFVARNAPFRCLESDILMEKCGREVLFCDIGAIGINQLAVEGTKTCLNATIANTCL